MLYQFYKDNSLQHSKKVQLKLLEFFVLKVTARSVADLLGIHPNLSSSILPQDTPCDRISSCLRSEYTL